jgi:hypothetical protein
MGLRQLGSSRSSSVKQAPPQRASQLAGVSCTVRTMPHTVVLIICATAHDTYEKKNMQAEFRITCVQRWLSPVAAKDWVLVAEHPGVNGCVKVRPACSSSSSSRSSGGSSSRNDRSYKAAAFPWLCLSVKSLMAAEPQVVG